MAAGKRGRPHGTMKPENKVILAAFPKLRSAENFHSWSEIAAIFNVSRETVLGLAHRHGWTGRRPVKRTTPRQPSAPRRYVPKENRI